MDGKLAGLVRQTIKANLLKGMKLDNTEFEVYMLQVDDTLFYMSN